MSQELEKSPLERWIDAQKDNPSFEAALRKLVSYACAEWFRRENLVSVDPEEALARVLATDLPAFPLGKWLDSPARFAPQIADFCEKTKVLPLPEALKGEFPKVLDLRGVKCPNNAARSRLVMAGLPEGASIVRGVKCPNNAARSRLVMAGLPEGASIDIYLDEGSPIENVPGALVADGHIVQKRQKNEGFWLISVVKRSGRV